MDIGTGERGWTKDGEGDRGVRLFISSNSLIPMLQADLCSSIEL